MAIILNIDTSGTRGLVALASNGNVIKTVWNNEPMQHASFVQPAIDQLLQDTGISISEIDAVAVSNGPGSYTGLRVGLASAKGLCYALNKPLIALSTLQVLAYSISQQMIGTALQSNDGSVIDNHMHLDYKKSLPVMYCPMIDARRMEVFFALYDAAAQEVLQPKAAIVDVRFLQDYIDYYQVVAVGTGAEKWKNISDAGNVLFVPEPMQDKALCSLSHEKYEMSKFDSLVDIEPFYAKEFHSTNPLHQGQS